MEGFDAAEPGFGTGPRVRWDGARVLEFFGVVRVANYLEVKPTI